MQQKLCCSKETARQEGIARVVSDSWASCAERLMFTINKLKRYRERDTVPMQQKRTAWGYGGYFPPGHECFRGNSENSPYSCVLDRSLAVYECCLLLVDSNDSEKFSALLLCTI